MHPEPTPAPFAEGVRESQSCWVEEEGSPWSVSTEVQHPTDHLPFLVLKGFCVTEVERHKGGTAYKHH